MARIPAFAQMTGPEKQKMHDWLVCMGGFALSNYMDAKQRSDAQGLATMKEFAGYSMRLVLGIDAKNLKLSGSRIIVDVPATSSPINGRILGAWSTSSAMNNGHCRLRYIFNADGSYSFKSERNYTSQRWWTDRGEWFVFRERRFGDDHSAHEQSHAPQPRRCGPGNASESAREGDLQVDHTFLRGHRRDESCVAATVRDES